MYSSLPDLNWARQTIYSNGKVEVFDCDGKYHIFETYEESKFWLLEDEYTSFELIDSEDEKELGIVKNRIQPPTANNDTELLTLMYVKSIEMN